MSAEARHTALIRAVIIGITGRMGRSLLRAAPGFPQLIITGAIASPGSLALGRDAGEVAGTGSANLTVSSDLPHALGQADVALDFSSAAAAAGNLAACRAAHVPLLLGTSGLGPELEGELTRAAHEIPLLVAANTSLALAVLIELTRSAAGALPRSFDIDVLDLHHRLKPDAPSGTALALGGAAAEARGTAVSAAAARRGDPLARAPGARPEGEIGFAAVRAGDLVGEHRVLFSGPGEELTLGHRATDRAVFARGALAAALWLAARSPGRYGMRDFLGVKTIT
jgi:4-hydroxy-tetrahydrodipicolinate reductase